MTRSVALPLLVLLAVWSLPRVGFAAPSLSSKDTSAPRSLHLLPEDTTPSLDDEPPTPQAQPGHGLTRVGVELGIGLALGLPAGLVGVVSVLRSGCGSTFGSINSDCRRLLPTAWILGTGLGASLGVAVGASFLQGRGSYWRGALPGALLGAVAGVGVALLTPDFHAGAALACPLLMLTGAILGYERTHASAVASRLRPVVGLSSRGTLLGLSGAF